MRHGRPPRGPERLALSVLAACGLLSACAGGPRADPLAAPVDEATWRALATPRPEPAQGAPRIALTAIDLAGTLAFPADAPVSAPLAVSELVATGLLARQDIHFVERRRFDAAVARERAGGADPGGPPAGVSARPDYLLGATWVPLGRGSATLEMRLLDPVTGAIQESWRAQLPGGDDPVRIARGIVHALASHLDSAGRLPSVDPAGAPGLPTGPGSGSGPGARALEGGPPSNAAFSAFLRGLSAEERWDWEEARAGYQRALAEAPGFEEARAALARTARLRLGGTLGAS